MYVLNRYLVFIFLFLYEKVAVTTGEVVADSRLLDGTDTFGNETMILRREESEIIANAEHDDGNIDISTRNHSVKKGSKKQGKAGTMRFCCAQIGKFLLTLRSLLVCSI